MSCGSSNAGSQLAAQQAAQEALTNQSVAQINQAFSGFTPQFYQKAGQAYTNYQMPMLQQQYQNNQNNLGFRLADQGLGKSSQAQGAYNALGQANTQATQQVAQGALGQQQQLQQQVGQEQSNLVGQAQTATNPSSIGQMATLAASNFAAPSALQPIGNLFNNFSTQYLGNQLANTYNPATALLLSYGLGGYGQQGGANSFLPSTTGQ